MLFTQTFFEEVIVNGNHFLGPECGTAVVCAAKKIQLYIFSGIL
jgi:hypothetical protein